ncbi:hypothetical protein GBW32_01345 [Streptomyces tsukubensis]|nr:hypothetical protein GBW32_01345 [Streptomyces tsukubensis]
MSDPVTASAQETRVRPSSRADVRRRPRRCLQPTRHARPPAGRGGAAEGDDGTGRPGGQPPEKPSGRPDGRRPLAAPTVGPCRSHGAVARSAR